MGEYRIGMYSSHPPKHIGWSPVSLDSPIKIAKGALALTTTHLYMYL